MHVQSPKRFQRWLNNCNTTKKPKLLNKLRTIPTTNATEEEQRASALDIPTSGLNQSTQSSSKSVNDKFNLKWLRVSVCYHRFTILREIFQGDLSRKLTVGLTSKDFGPLPHNCRTSGNCICGCNNMWRNSIAVCKVKCNHTGKVHIGNTQQKFNTSMKSKSLSNLATNQIHMPNTLQPNSMMQILPQSNNVEEQPASSCGRATQSVQSKPSLPKTTSCVPKRELQFLSNPQLLINSNNKICSACGLRPRFHRHAKQTIPNTHESINDERVSPGNTQSCHRFC